MRVFCKCGNTSRAHIVTHPTHHTSPYTNTLPNPYTPHINQRTPLTYTHTYHASINATPSTSTPIHTTHQSTHATHTHPYILRINQCTPLTYTPRTHNTPKKTNTLNSSPFNPSEYTATHNYTLHNVHILQIKQVSAFV